MATTDAAPPAAASPAPADEWGNCDGDVGFGDGGGDAAASAAYVQRLERRLQALNAPKLPRGVKAGDLADPDNSAGMRALARELTAANTAHARGASGDASTATATASAGAAAAVAPPVAPSSAASGESDDAQARAAILRADGDGGAGDGDDDDDAYAPIDGGAHATVGASGDQRDRRKAAVTAAAQQQRKPHDSLSDAAARAGSDDSNDGDDDEVVIDLGAGTGLFVPRPPPAGNGGGRAGSPGGRRWGATGYGGGADGGGAADADDYDGDDVEGRLSAPFPFASASDFCAALGRDPLQALIDLTDGVAAVLIRAARRVAAGARRVAEIAQEDGESDGLLHQRVGAAAAPAEAGATAASAETPSDTETDGSALRRESSSGV
jgi:hypothetical protein